MRLGAWVVLGLLVVCLSAAGWNAYQSERSARVEAELRLHQQYKVNDSTNARLTTTIVAKDSVTGLLTAARQLNGELVAALRIRVAKRETVIVHTSLPTVLQPDSTRIAHVDDSTFAGRITGDITAPPCCAPLRFDYTLTRPEFSPSVGFVRVGNSVAAVVNWQGETFQIEAPYANIGRPVKRLGGGLEALYLPTNGGMAIRAFGLYRAFWGLELQAGGEQRTGGDANLFVGAAKRW